MITRLTLGLILSLGVAKAAETNAPAAATNAAPATVATPPAPQISAPADAKPKAKTTAKKKAKKAVAAKPAAPSAAAKSEGRVDINPPETAVTKQDAINVRGQPSFVGEVVTKLRKGESVTLLEEITLSKTKKDEPARWFRITMPTNTPVWVSANFIDATTKTVTPKKLQMRGGPGENYSVVGSLVKGAVVKEIRRTNDWIEIEAPADAYGFVAADLIERSTPTAPVAPAVAPAAPEIVAVPPAAAPPTPPPSEATPPAAPATIPPVVTPPPVVVTPPPVEEEPLPKRIVTREGIVRRSLNVQTPSYYELESPDTGKIINYLFSSRPGFTLKPLIGTRVSVTGEESIDKRWKNTPVIEIESIEQR